MRERQRLQLNSCPKSLLADMRRTGYKIHLYYLWLPGFKLSLKRIAERVKRGGHNIPKEVVIRRYGRGLINLFRHYMPLSDYCAIFDNSTTPNLVYERLLREERIVDGKLFKTIKNQLEEVR